jgi:radical SAM protein with 4Fe4S-binding SPASM domain
LSDVVFSDLSPLGRGRGCGQYTLNEDEEQRMIAQALKIRAEYADKIGIRLSSRVEHLCQLAAMQSQPPPQRPTCAAGMEEFAIRADGAAHPCALIWGDDFAMGNAHERSLLELWNSPKLAFFRGGYEMSELKTCAACEHLNRCGKYICPGPAHHERRQVRPAGQLRQNPPLCGGVRPPMQIILPAGQSGSQRFLELLERFIDIEKYKKPDAPLGQIRRDFYRKGGRLSYPLSVMLDLTSHCNQNCVFCYRGQTQGSLSGGAAASSALG